MNVDAGLAPAHFIDSATGPVGVVDIGSNSVRLVVYDGRQRAPIPLFNERVLCGLGRDIGQTGVLHPDGVTRALKTLRRFANLARHMRVEDISAVATAAVRDAADGPEFVRAVEQNCGFSVDVISGEDEARYSALGVVSGFPQASGIMGDMGGGSLELVEIGKHDDEAGQAITLPLGVLRMMETMTGGAKAARAAIETQLDRAPWLVTDRETGAGGARGGVFYAVGGTWRSLARIHMVETGYALRVIDHYQVPTKKLLKILARVAKMSHDEVAAYEGVKQARIDTLPVAARVLAAVLKRIQPKSVMFSGQGLREGLLYHRLQDEVREQDPLLEAARAFVRTARRFAPISHDLLEITAPIFARESDAERRLRLAACLLADIGWREHPNHRADHVIYRVLNLPAVGLTHEDRLFLAETLATRYGKDLPRGAMEAAESLLRKGTIRRARVLGTTLRLALTLCGAAPDVLPLFSLQSKGKTLRLRTGPEGSGYLNEIVEARLAQLATVVGKTPEVKVSK